MNFLSGLFRLFHFINFYLFIERNKLFLFFSSLMYEDSTTKTALEAKQVCLSSHPHQLINADSPAN